MFINNVTSLGISTLYCLLIFVVVALGTNGNNVFAQKGQWLEWKDPDNQFSLQYPSNWTVTPRENRFEDRDVSFNIGANSTFSIEVYNTSSTDLRAIMERVVEANEGNLGLIKRKLFEGPDYSKYTVSERPAGSVIWTADVPFLGKIVRQNIASIVGDKFVGILHDSTASEFDKYSSDVVKVIRSIKIK